jgi:hypothetical protein
LQVCGKPVRIDCMRVDSGAEGVCIVHLRLSE